MADTFSSRPSIRAGLRNSARILDFEIPWTVDQIDAAKAEVAEAQ